MTNYTTESEKTPQKPSYTQITAFSGATKQATIFNSPSIENTNDIIDKIYYKPLIHHNFVCTCWLVLFYSCFLSETDKFITSFAPQCGHVIVLLSAVVCCGVWSNS